MEAQLSDTSGDSYITRSELREAISLVEKLRAHATSGELGVDLRPRLARDYYDTEEEFQEALDKNEGSVSRLRDLIEEMTKQGFVFNMAGIVDPRSGPEWDPRDEAPASPGLD